MADTPNDMPNLNAAAHAGAAVPVPVPVLSRREGSCLVLTLDRPGAGNSLDYETLQALRRELARGAADPAVRSIVLTGSGEKFFCTGGDVKRYRQLADAEQFNQVFDVGRALLDQIESLDKPVIAAINGYALGGGLELALACDLRFAHASAQLGLPQSRLGIIPGWNGVERLLRTVGRAPAMRLLLTGERIASTQALAIGLVDEVVQGAVLPAALAFCAGLDQAAPLSLAALKKTVTATLSLPRADARAVARELMAELWFTADHKEAEAAFAEKRLPRFTGR
jgi:enoyl-CoA hydratase/carnithine racemase